MKAVFLMYSEDTRSIELSTGIACEAIDIGMIVRDEAAFLPRALEPLLIAGFNSFVILDMGSRDQTRDIAQRILGNRLRLMTYPRASLIEHGFAEARNVCSRFGSKEWILFVDADEVLTEGVENGCVTLKTIGKNQNMFFVTRRNLETLPENGGPGKAKSVERHLRLYKPTFIQRWDGYIHEELHVSGSNGAQTAGESSLSLDHYSIFKSRSVLDKKDSLYAHMLLKGFNDKALRQGTSRYWYEEFVPQHYADLSEKSKMFKETNNNIIE